MNVYKTQTVSELNKSIKILLENGFSFISVIGEVSNLRKPYSGHIYFSLKDETSQLKAVLFKMQRRYLDYQIEDGMKVVCNGRISLYEPRGEYQLIVDTVNQAGRGELQAAFEQLKLKLSKEGLFDLEKKKQPVLLPEKIAIITSPQSAAIADFLKIAATRCPSIPIDIYPVRVQGEMAAAEIIEAIQTINQGKRAETIVICRGGGSMEDLWPFNNEELAREIFTSKIPIVSAIGHEIDFTIADMAADLRAPTPTAAAEMVMPNSKMIIEKIHSAKTRISYNMLGKIKSANDRFYATYRLLYSYSNTIANYQLHVDHTQDKLIQVYFHYLNSIQHQVDSVENKFKSQSPGYLINLKGQKLESLTIDLKKAIQRLISNKKSDFQKNAALLNSVSPLAVLGRGYAIVKSAKGKNIIFSSNQVKPGEHLEIKLSKGEINCKVIS